MIDPACSQRFRRRSSAVPSVARAVKAAAGRPDTAAAQVRAALATAVRAARRHTLDSRAQAKAEPRVQRVQPPRVAAAYPVRAVEAAAKGAKPAETPSLGVLLALQIAPARVAVGG